MRQCSVCKQLLDENAFHKDKTRREGLAYICKECKKRYVYPVQWRIYRESHRQERRSYQKVYDAAHPLSLERRREKHNRYKTQDLAAFKAADRAKAERRRARKAGLPATLTDTEWQKILQQYDYKCAYCRVTGPLQQEHVIPVIQGGGYTKENIVPACPKCNRKKGPRTPEEAGMNFVSQARP